MTRDQLLAEIRSADARAEARLIEGSAERFGEWSAKDVLCHLAAWQRIAGLRLQARRQGREPATSELLGHPVDEAEGARVAALDLDPFNDYLADLHRDRGWPEARRLWTESRDLLLAEVARLDDAELAADEAFGRGVGEDSFLHVPIHLGG